MSVVIHRAVTQQIEHLLQEYHSLLEAAIEAEPGLVERTALGAVLQSFYTGVENIFQTIAKRVDMDMPSVEEGHRELLSRMSHSTDQRDAVICEATADLLKPYLGFRHVSRRAYSFRLEWPQMQNLVRGLPDVWAQVSSDVRGVLDKEK